MSSTNPPEGSGQEYLDQGAGTPVGSTSTTGSGSGRRTALLVGVGVAGLAVVGGAVWAAMSFLGNGPQPAEALPGNTVGYASIDLDPSGGQKIEAFKMLRKFPAIKEQLDKVGLTSADEDLKATIFDQVQKSGACPGLSYDRDVKPWLGDRFAVAAVDLGKDSPTPVVVLQVTDAGAADKGLAALSDCAGSSASDTSGSSNDLGGWSIEGDWAVLAQTDDLAKQVTDDAAKGTLADDADFQKWTGEAGDPGVMTLYAAPEAGQFLAKMGQDLGGMLGGSGYASSSGMGSGMGSDMGMGSGQLPPQVVQQLKDFKGMAGTLRFDSGALEFEVATDASKNTAAFAGGEGASVVSTLPSDTAAAIGVGFGKGWAQQILDNISSAGGGAGVDQLLSQLENQTGLTLPDDLETLLGDSAALSVSSSLDPEAMANSSDGSQIPVGLKVKGDADQIDGVLSKLAALAPPQAPVFQSDAKDGYVAIGPDSAYRASLLKDGKLGDTDEFQNVVREGDRAKFVLFVNFNAGDWLTKLAGSDPTAKANLEPLQGVGMSVWLDGDVSHGSVRLTTDN